jgi:hypothetical protein
MKTNIMKILRDFFIVFFFERKFLHIFAFEKKNYYEFEKLLLNCSLQFLSKPYLEKTMIKKVKKNW